MILELILKWFIPFFFGGVISWLIAMLKNAKKKDKALEDGVQSLLRGEIIRQHDKYVDERGWCPIYAKEALKREYDAYHNLGGNDVATALYKEIMELPDDERRAVKRTKNTYWEV